MNHKIIIFLQVGPVTFTYTSLAHRVGYYTDPNDHGHHTRNSCRI